MVSKNLPTLVKETFRQQMKSFHRRVLARELSGAHQKLRRELDQESHQGRIKNAPSALKWEMGSRGMHHMSDLLV